MGGLDILRARGPERYLEGNWYYLGMPKNVGPHFLPFGPTFFHHATYVPIFKVKGCHMEIIL